MKGFDVYDSYDFRPPTDSAQTLPAAQQEHRLQGIPRAGRRNLDADVLRGHPRPAAQGDRGGDPGRHRQDQDHRRQKAGLCSDPARRHRHAGGRALDGPCCQGRPHRHVPRPADPAAGHLLLQAAVRHP